MPSVYTVHNEPEELYVALPTLDQTPLLGASGYSQQLP
jgi:hypothetical protein